MRGNFSKTVPRNSTSWSAFAAEKPDAVKRKSYAQLQKEAQQKAAEDSVLDLLAWEENALGEDDTYGKLKENIAGETINLQDFEKDKLNAPFY